MITKQITVDLWKPTRPTISFQQFEEEGRTLVISLTAGSLPVNVNGADVYFYAKKPDGTIVFNDCVILDGAKGQVAYTVTAQTCILAGELECFIGIVKAGPQHVRTPIFKITVNASPDVSEAVESTSEFTALTEALATLAGFIPSGSLVQDENGLHLVGDEAAPAVPSGYGWDGANKRFLPFQKSIKFENGGIELEGDETTPVNKKYYGMVGGTKGFHGVSQIITGSDHENGLPAGATRFVGHGSHASSAYRRAIVFPIAGTIKNLRVYSSGAPGAGQSYTCTVMVNNVAQPVACIIGAAENTAMDTTNTCPAPAGARVVVRFVASAGAATSLDNLWGFEFIQG